MTINRYNYKSLKSKTHHNSLIQGSGIMPEEEMSYEVFKQKITSLLKENTNGMTWGKIAQILDLPQTVPNDRIGYANLKQKQVYTMKRTMETLFWFLPTRGLIYTIGYEGKDITQFIERLKLVGVEQLIDVREIALSRKNGLAKNALRKSLNDNNMVYKHLPELGSPSDIRHKLHDDWDYVYFFNEYTKYLECTEAKNAMVELENLAHMRKSVIMCFGVFGGEVSPKNFERNAFSERFRSC